MTKRKTSAKVMQPAACERPVQETVPEADLHYAVLDYLEKGNIQTAATLLEADIGKIVTPG